MHIVSQNLFNTYLTQLALILFHLFTYLLNNDKQLLIGIPVMSSLHIILCSPLFISLISNDLIFRKYFKQYNHTDDKTKTQLLIYLNQIKPPKACIRLNHTQIIAAQTDYHQYSDSAYTIVKRNMQPMEHAGTTLTTQQRWSDHLTRTKSIHENMKSCSLGRITHRADCIQLC